MPSSNVTMETEIPALLCAREDILPDYFIFHSSRMRMKNVTKEELEKMDDDYIESEGVEVKDYLSLEIPNNLDVASQDPMAPGELWKKLDTKNVDAIVASACVQMPSLPVIEAIETQTGYPYIVCFSYYWAILKSLGLEPVTPGGGTLLKENLENYQK